MNPLTFEQIVAAVSFLGMVLTLINGAKAMNRASQEDAMRLVRLEEGVKQLKSDLDDTQKAFTAYMARTDETGSGRGCDSQPGGTAGTPRTGEYTLILI